MPDVRKLLAILYVWSNTSTYMSVSLGYKQKRHFYTSTTALYVKIMIHILQQTSFML